MVEKCDFFVHIPQGYSIGTGAIVLKGLGHGATGHAVRLNFYC